jgi:hypothetical protein
MKGFLILPFRQVHRHPFMTRIDDDLAAKPAIFLLIDGEGQHVRFQLVDLAATVPPFVGDIDMAGRTSRKATAVTVNAFKFMANGP